MAGKLLEPLLLEARRYFARTFVALFELRELEALADARLAETGADLEHESGSVDGRV